MWQKSKQNKVKSEKPGRHDKVKRLKWCIKKAEVYCVRKKRAKSDVCLLTQQCILHIVRYLEAIRLFFLFYMFHGTWVIFNFENFC